MVNRKFTYEEPKDALNARISAHAQFSNFNLHNWIAVRFKINVADRILDLGCGNGNYTRLFWDFIKPSGYILGLDKNESLINQAINQHNSLPEDNVQFLVQDYDNPFPDLGAKYNWIFSIYSLYYTEDSLKLLQTIKNKLAPGGTFVVIGPGPENTKDLMEFNYALTGKKAGQEHVERIERIAKEFKPLFMEMFSKEKVGYEEVDSVMEFPDIESYGEYYMSTLLWRESVKDYSEEKIESIKEEMRKRLVLPAKIKKQMSCLVGSID